MNQLNQSTAIDERGDLKIINRLKCKWSKREEFGSWTILYEAFNPPIVLFASVINLIVATTI